MLLPRIKKESLLLLLVKMKQITNRFEGLKPLIRLLKLNKIIHPSLIQFFVNQILFDAGIYKTVRVNKIVKEAVGYKICFTGKKPCFPERRFPRYVPS